MPAPNANLAYTGIDRPTLPYASNLSPTNESPHFITGSQNVLATLSEWLEKRPGFSAAIETSISALPGTVKRLFFWKRWAGSTTNPDAFYLMACVILANVAKVYKLNIGVDASFTLVWTETTSDGTGVPFDFQDSNNFVFFGNASTRQDMRKYDGTTCSLWGIDAPISAPNFALVSGDLPPGLAFDSASGTISGTPTEAVDTSLTVTVTDTTGATATQTLSLFIDPAGLQWETPSGALPPSVAGTAYTETLVAQSGTAPLAYSLYSGTLPAGLSLSSAGVLSGTPTTPANAVAFAVKVTDSATPTPATAIQSFSLFVGSSALSLTPTSLPDATVGTAYTETLTASGGTGPYAYAIIGGSLPAGLSIASSTGIISGTPTTAGSATVNVRVTDTSVPAKVTEFLLPFNVDATSLTVTTLTLPNPQVGIPYSQAINTSGGTSPFTFSYTSGSLSAYTGYVGGYTYTSIYGHESSMSPLSANTGLFTDQNIEWDVLASSDPQVNGINIYRTADGGDIDPGVMRLVVSLTNATQSYTDSTIDTLLGTQTGPGLYLNNPPQPLRGFVWSNGRIWGFSQQATWFTGNEEITNGVPVECMSNAKDGNFYQWPSEVGGMAVTPNGVDIGLSEEFWQVSGDTLDTFRKSQLLQGGGVLSPTCIVAVGTTVYWVDTGKQVWSSSTGEIGEAIRPDLVNIDPFQSFIGYHKFQTRNWLYVLDGANGKLLIYDLDLNLWQTPWTVAATSIASGKTSFTNIGLVAAFSSGHVTQLANGSYVDDSNVYGDQIRTGQFSVVPGSSTKARNSTEVRQPMQFEMEMSAIAQAPNLPDEFYALADDDPFQVPLSNWADVNDPQPLQFGQQAQTGLTAPANLAARRWMLNQAPQSPVGTTIFTAHGVLKCRRISMCAVWNARAQGWKVYSLDLAVSTV